MENALRELEIQLLRLDSDLRYVSCRLEDEFATKYSSSGVNPSKLLKRIKNVEDELPKLREAFMKNTARKEDLMEFTNRVVRGSSQMLLSAQRRVSIPTDSDLLQNNLEEFSTYRRSWESHLNQVVGETTGQGEDGIFTTKDDLTFHLLNTAEIGSPRGNESRNGHGARGGKTPKSVERRRSRTGGSKGVQDGSADGALCARGADSHSCQRPPRPRSHGSQSLKQQDTLDTATRPQAQLHTHPDTHTHTQTNGQGGDGVEEDFSEDASSEGCPPFEPVSRVAYQRIPTVFKRQHPLEEINASYHRLWSLLASHTRGYQGAASRPFDIHEAMACINEDDSGDIKPSVVDALKSVGAVRLTKMGLVLCPSAEVGRAHLFGRHK
eukprot:Rmarinus@m.10624